MTKNDLTNDKKMTKKWHHKTGMTKKCKTKWQKMTKINNQQPSEFAGKIFIMLQAMDKHSGGLWFLVLKTDLELLGNSLSDPKLLGLPTRDDNSQIGI